MFRLATRTNVVHPSGQHPETHQEIVIRFIWGPTSLSWKNAIRNPIDVVQGSTLGQLEGRADGNLGFFKVGQELVFLENLGIGPSSGTVELGDEARPIFEFDFVDSILERVERITEWIARVASFFDGFEHFVWGEREEEIGRRHEDVVGPYITGVGFH